MTGDKANQELIDAAEQLLAWQPNCSLGSSGDLRQKRLRAAIDAETIDKPVNVKQAPRQPTITFGDGDYSCAKCGFGMVEPCEHWKKMLAHAHPEVEAEAPPSRAAKDLLEAIVESAISDDDACSICREDISGEHRHSEGCVILLAERFLLGMKEAEAPRKPREFSELKEIPRLRELAKMVTDNPCFTNAILAVTEAYAEGVRGVSQHPSQTFEQWLASKPPSYASHYKIASEAWESAVSQHPEPAPEGWSVKELIDTAEKLLEWMPIYSKGNSGHIRQMNLRAAIDKFKAELPEPTKGGGE